MVSAQAARGGLRVSNLNAPAWSRADIDRLVDLYGTMTNAELGASMETPRSEGLYKARRERSVSPERIARITGRTPRKCGDVS